MTLSVIVPTFGDFQRWDALARHAVESLAGQPCEVVRVHAYTLAGARNGGAERATGDLIAFLDADDRAGPGYAAAMLAADGSGAILVPSVERWRAGELEQAAAPPLRANILRRNWPPIGCALSRAAFLDLGGFDDGTWGEDWSFWIRATVAGMTFVDVPDAVYQIHARPNSLSMNPPETGWQTIRARWLPIARAKGLRE